VFNFLKKPTASLLMESEPGSGGTASDPWRVLNLFFQELQSIDKPSRELRSLVQALYHSLGADAVFLVSFHNNEVVEVVGRKRLSSAWCRQFTERLLSESPGVTQLVRSDLIDPPTRTKLLPQSVALIQISETRKAWAVALSFNPDRRFGLSDLQMMGLAKRMLRNHFRHLRTVHKLKETLIGIVHCLTASVDAKDPYTCGHSERVARIAVRLGQQMQLQKTVLSDIYLAGLLHDIGKIGIKDSVLQKPGKLTDEERRHVQEHPVIGHHLLFRVRQLAHLLPGVRNHHERYDGQGYPDGLSGDDIPLLARVLAVADACDAMMSARPYRRAMPIEQIEAILQHGAGTQWDSQVVAYFMDCRHELYSICQRGIGDSLCLAVDHTVNFRSRAALEDAKRDWLAAQQQETPQASA
jgi:HD-GYP domain-containing protein (c-di-GMP phosphodiesterase class II)